VRSWLGHLRIGIRPALACFHACSRSRSLRAGRCGELKEGYLFLVRASCTLVREIAGGTLRAYVVMAVDVEALVCAGVRGLRESGVHGMGG